MSIMPPVDRDESEPRERPAEIVKKAEFVGVGALVQLIGAILGIVGFCVFLPINARLLIYPLAAGGVFLGLMLFIVGGRMAIVRVCSACRGKVDKQASRCPHCRAKLM
jgi:hypothetical protein